MDSKSPVEAPLAYDSGQSGWSKHEVAVVAIRLLAAYLAAQTIPWFTQFPFLGFMSADPRAIAYVAANLVAYVAAAVFMFVRAEALTSRLLPSQPTVPQDLDRTPTTVDLQGLAFSVVAVLMIVRGLPGILGMLYDWAHVGSLQPWQRLESIALTVGGVILFLRARGLSLVWHKIRTGGTDIRSGSDRP